MCIKQESRDLGLSSTSELDINISLSRLAHLFFCSGVYSNAKTRD